jgi:hypothetical protein
LDPSGLTNGPDGHFVARETAVADASPAVLSGLAPGRYAIYARSEDGRIGGATTVTVARQRATAEVEVGRSLRWPLEFQGGRPREGDRLLVLLDDDAPETDDCARWAQWFEWMRQGFVGPTAMLELAPHEVDEVVAPRVSAALYLSRYWRTVLLRRPLTGRPLTIPLTPRDTTVARLTFAGPDGVPVDGRRLEVFSDVELLEALPDSAPTVTRFDWSRRVGDLQLDGHGRCVLPVVAGAGYAFELHDPRPRSDHEWVSGPGESAPPVRWRLDEDGVPRLEKP